jgi:2-methylcitrate dehydratase PrpD
MKKNGITHADVEKVVIKTFKRATLLSKIEPETADEAQYNIAYPVASAIVYGDFGIDRVLNENLSDPTVLAMMKKLAFEVDDELDAKFPAKRICRAEIYTKDKEVFISPDCEPRGEACENIGVDWLVEKFYRITKPVISRELQEKLVQLITGDENIPVRRIVDAANGN